MMEIEQIGQYVGRRVRVIGGVQEAEGVLQGVRELSHDVGHWGQGVARSITDGWVLRIDGETHEFGPSPEFEVLD